MHMPDFLIVIDGQEETRILVQERIIDTLKALYDQYVNGVNPYF